MPTSSSPLGRLQLLTCLALLALPACGDAAHDDDALDVDASSAGPGGQNGGAALPDGGSTGNAGGSNGAGGSNDSGGSQGGSGDAGTGRSDAATNRDGATNGSTDGGSPGGGSPGAATPGGGTPGGGTPGGGTPGGTGDAQRVDNPYVGAKGYINPEWQAKAKAEPGGERVANTPTAVWIDRIAAINGAASQANGPMGVRDHLEAALKQGASYIQFVIYNLPGRDCSALASNGELGTKDIARYKSEYIDPITSIMGDAKYRALRIVNVIEVDSLPNLVTNTDVAKCVEMRDNGGYVQGIAYALQKLGGLPNTYNYVDAGHHGWLGWDENFNATAELFKQMASMAGISNVHGFITNTANYSALVEPFLDTQSSINGTQLRQAKWLDWNPYADELSFAQAFRQKLVSLGFDAGIGMLIDTSRNGWGGANRPSAKSTATDVDTFVNQSRIDRRVHAGNWCNQTGAGLGERPKASPAAGIDAYVWIKPPGESDGASKEIMNSDGKGFDRMCDPTYGGNARNGNSTTGALADAPLSGAWFSAQFQELMRNAYPAL